MMVCHVILYYGTKTNLNKINKLKTKEKKPQLIHNKYNKHDK